MLRNISGKGRSSSGSSLQFTLVTTILSRDRRHSPALLMFSNLLQTIRKGSFSESDPEIIEFVRAVKEKGLTDGATAELAQAMAGSGSILDIGRNATDVPSTGGPGSLSTLVSPILVALAGGKVVKVSVPGTPAGAIDTLETLPGFNSRLRSDEVTRLVANSSYVHIRAGSDFAPADAKLYAIRRQHDAVKSTELAVAS